MKESKGSGHGVHGLESRLPVLVITTRENSRWLSMQEIIPGIENVWKKAGALGAFPLRILEVAGPEGLNDLVSLARDVGRIVLTASTPGTIAAAVAVRKAHGILTPFLLYVHGDGTQAFQALGELRELLTEQDTFVVSCAGEAAAIRYCFSNARIAVVPFPLGDLILDHLATDTPATKGLPPFVYVGRISEQKNLHTLLVSLWILKNRLKIPGFRLDVYGTEDGYGNPNTQTHYMSYGTYLKGLAYELGLSEAIKWHGFKPRKWLLRAVHGSPHVYVSPTLHSDENFGASVLASLLSGNRAVVTGWGGHWEFRDLFPSQMTLVSAESSELGPFVDPFYYAQKLAETMRRSAQSRPLKVSKSVKYRFTTDAGVSEIVRVLDEPLTGNALLKRTPLMSKILERKPLLGGSQRRIFAGYDDPLSWPFFAAYGMLEKVRTSSKASKPVLLMPWIKRYAHDLRSLDPHRGSRRFDVGESSVDRSQVIYCPSMEVQELPARLVDRLCKMGLAFAEPEATKRMTRGHTFRPETAQQSKTV